MKKYIKPELNVTYVEVTRSILGASNVTTGGVTKDEYTYEDVSYGNEDRAWDIWGSESAEGCE